MKVRAIVVMVLLAVTVCSVFADFKTEGSQVYPIAVLNFQPRGKSMKDAAAQAGDLVFASLAETGEFYMVERQDISKVLKELELSDSGMVTKDAQNKIGQLTGAKILVTGSVFKSGKNTYVIVKVIGTETSRVFAAKASGSGSLETICNTAGKEAAKLIKNKGAKLMPKPVTKKDVIAEIKKEVKNLKLPVVSVSISEEAVRMATPDPAAQTEFMVICKETGFPVVESASDAKVNIKGEAFFELAGRVGNFQIVKARLEVTATDKSGKVIAVDRETVVKPGLAAGVTGKSAIQEAAQTVAERMLPKIAKAVK